MNINSELTIQDFGVLMADRVKDTLGENVSVEYKEIIKNNGVVHHALVIKRDGDNVAPTIYIEEFYREYRKEKDTSNLPELIADFYRKNSGRDLDVEFFSDFAKVCANLTFRVVNIEKNKEMLKDVPYKKFEDLALVPLCSIRNHSIGNGSIVIHKQHLSHWEVSYDELWENVFEHAKEVSKVRIESIFKFVSDKTGIPFEDIEEKIYVITNESMLYGAAVAFYPGVLKNVAKKVGSDLIIIPSSVHEMIVVPAHEQLVGIRELIMMIREVNETVVCDEEVLSNNAYYYDAAEDIIRIAESC